MAKKYTASIQLRCWKQHECSICGSEYAYILTRNLAGTGSSADRASAALKRNYEKAQRDDNDMQPCPACGNYQPDMIGTRLLRRRNWLLVASFVMPILLPILRASYAVQADTLTWVAVIYCALAVAAQFLLGRANPNRNLAANRALAAQRVNADLIHIRNLQNTQNPTLATLPTPAQSLAHKTAFLLLLVAVILAAVPELTRRAAGWPLNPDCYPPVVGPTDSTRVYMNEEISSVKGFWRGSPQVTVTSAISRNPVEIKIPVPSTANQNDWGDSIYVKPEEKSSSSHPWVEMTLPDAAHLPQGAILCHIDLNIEFPQIAAGSTFTVERRHMARNITLWLAPTGAGARYNAAWWIGTLAATLGVLLAGILLAISANRFRRQAKPTRIFPMEAPTPPPSPAAPAAPPIQPA